MRRLTEEIGMARSVHGWTAVEDSSNDDAAYAADQCVRLAGKSITATGKVFGSPDEDE